MKTSHLFPIAAILVLTAGSCEGSTNPDTVAGPVAAVVSFTFDGRPTDTLHVLVTHRPTIDAAQRYVNTGQGPKLPIGPIVRGAGYDTRYPFHFRPADIRLADFAIELCDGALMRSAADVDAFFLGSTGSVSSTQATWCPWGARPYHVQVLPQ